MITSECSALRELATTRGLQNRAQSHAPVAKCVRSTAESDPGVCEGNLVWYSFFKQPSAFTDCVGVQYN
jgi:hypothetical protein